MAMLDEIGKRLHDQSIGVLGTSLFLGYMPDTPDACTAVIETPGSSPVDAFGSTTPPAWERPRIQVLCRGVKEDYSTPRSNAGAAFRTLTKVVNQNLASTASTGQYLRVEAVQSPFLLERDAKQRCVVACNYAVSRKST